MTPIWNFYSAGQLVFGRGAAERLGPLAARRGWEKVVLITDGTLAAAGLVEHVTRPLGQVGIACELFADGEAEPSVAVAEAAIGFVRERRPDALVALGGGSNMDLAKIAAVVATHGGAPQDYFGFDRVPGPIMPLVCLPTTAGTGSEVSHAAVLTDTANQIKVSTLSQHLRPALAVVDPALTDGCPKQVTADSGIDALTHAVEAYLATENGALHVAPGESIGYEGSFPLADILAEHAIRMIGRFLATAVRDGRNTAARDGMALAATLAGLAFSNAGVALVHALEYPLGAAVHCSHGAGNGLLLPYVMRFNLPVRQRKLARIAELLGADTQGLDETAAAEKGIEAVERLRLEIGIPARLRELGAKREQLPHFAEKAFAIRRLRLVNPRPATQADLLQILEAAY